MKEQRFIELLNLYIDRQITAEETAELESEIQASPQRQAVYRQYCQIHTATKQVYASFRASSADPQAVAEPGHVGVIELFESRRRRTNWVHYTGGLVAAACLALVFVRNNPTAPAAAPVLAAKSQPVMVAAAPVATVAPVASPAAAVETVPGLLSLRNTTTSTPNYTAMLAALREQDEERAFSNERIYVSATPSLFGDEAFDSKRALSPQEERIFRSRQTPSASSASHAEFSAFQFQR